MATNYSETQYNRFRLIREGNLSFLVAQWPTVIRMLENPHNLIYQAPLHCPGSRNSATLQRPEEPPSHGFEFSFYLSTRLGGVCRFNDVGIRLISAQTRFHSKLLAMPFIPLEDHLPGITGLLEYRKDSAEPIRELTQFLLRGPSTLSEGERELIATVVSHRNECRFCTAAHTAAANVLLGENETAEKVKHDISTAPISNKMKRLLTIASQVQESGKKVTGESVKKAKEAGATDLEIHDTVLIAALFCLYNRYVDGLSAVTPTNPDFYSGLAQRIAKGYQRLPQGYDHLKKK